MNVFKNKQKGFTLIELLVVIAIITLLSSIVMASLNGAREKAKIASDIAFISQLRTVFNLYRNDTGYYPGDWTDLDTLASGTFFYTNHIYDQNVCRGRFPCDYLLSNDIEYSGFNAELAGVNGEALLDLLIARKYIPEKVRFLNLKNVIYIVGGFTPPCGGVQLKEWAIIFKTSQNQTVNFPKVPGDWTSVNDVATLNDGNFYCIGE